MRMSSSLLASFLIPTIAAAVLAPSCGGGEMPGTTNGSSGGSGTGSGGNLTSPSSGGSTFSSGTGNGSGSGSGGSSSTGSGGTIIMGATGGASSSGSGGSPLITGLASGGSTLITGPTGGSTVMGTPGSLMTSGGFTTNGTWMGYAYPFTGPMTGSKATVTPASFMTATSLCVMGSIAPDPTYTSVAGLGWSIAQTIATAPAIGTIATSGTGLVINVANVTGLMLTQGGGSQLRAQIQNATTNWCAPIAASGVSMLPWGMFNTKCYDTTQAGAAAYTVGTPLTAVQLIVPSAMTAIGPFGFCLADAHPY